MFLFFPAVNHLCGPLRKQNFYFNKFKFLWLVDFDQFCVSVLQGPLLGIVIMIDSIEKHNCKLAIEFQSSRVIKKHSNLQGPK